MAKKNSQYVASKIAHTSPRAQRNIEVHHFRALTESKLSKLKKSSTTQVKQVQGRVVYFGCSCLPHQKRKQKGGPEKQKFNTCLFCEKPSRERRPSFPIDRVVMQRLLKKLAITAHSFRRSIAIHLRLLAEAGVPLDMEYISNAFGWEKELKQWSDYACEACTYLRHTLVGIAGLVNAMNIKKRKIVTNEDIVFANAKVVDAETNADATSDPTIVEKKVIARSAAQVMDAGDRPLADHQAKSYKTVKKQINIRVPVNTDLDSLDEADLLLEDCTVPVR